MNKKDIAEIKRRLKLEKTTITRVCGCYVDEKKDIVTTFNRNFLDLEEEEAHKYLELASKALSGTPSNNLLELEFSSDEEISGGMQSSLVALKSSGLTDEVLLNAFYNKLIDNYDTVDHYLILLFYDNYDVPMKTTDNMTLDDSEEVYEYIIGCICPVKLSQPGLSFHDAENRIAPRIRDWVVGAVESGFTFPCFTERSTDLYHILVYTKNAKEPHTELWEDCLGAMTRFTSTQKRNGFLGLVTKAVGEENEQTPEVLLDVQQNLCDYVTLKQEYNGNDDPVILEEKDIVEILEDSGLTESRSQRIASSYEEMFPEDSTSAEELYEARAIKNNELRKEKKLLQEKVIELNDKLLELGLVDKNGQIIDVAVRIRPDREEAVSTSFIDGRKCLVIPLSTDDTATVNGEELSL